MCENMAVESKARSETYEDGTVFRGGRIAGAGWLRGSARRGSEWELADADWHVAHSDSRLRRRVVRHDRLAERAERSGYRQAEDRQEQCRCVEAQPAANRH